MTGLNRHSDATKTGVDGPRLPVTELGSAFATSEAAHTRFFPDGSNLLPLWLAEPYLPLWSGVVKAVQARAAEGWYGYEERPADLAEAFRDWTMERYGWNTDGLAMLVSPSIGTSIGVLLDLLTQPGDGVILQPPVFTDFKPLVRRASRQVIRNSLVLADGRYEMDLEALATVAADPTVNAMILCNPHNPVGRVWSVRELARVASVCAEHDVFVIADEIHADLMLPPHRFTPFAAVAAGSGVRWAALHGPLKTFGVAGLCDTLLITDDEEAKAGFQARNRALHLNRTNVLGVAAFRAGYESGGPWLDEMLRRVASNVETLRRDLPHPITVIEPEATYLAWLDLRGLGMEVPQLATWLTSQAGLALSPGHWFGREGAGFARMSIAVEPNVLAEAIHRLAAAVVGYAGGDI